MTSILADHQYTLNDFAQISHGLNSQVSGLSSEVIQSINRIINIIIDERDGTNRLQ